ncbi:MAG: gliding motility-associated C-terminal domain-containing protein [Bacteroidetes bacterium]|nr:gliding motility-associated C-terminal domain-containing protein [Bacteroidota bacterium]
MFFSNTLKGNESIVLALSNNNNSYCVDKISDTIQVHVRDCDTSLYVSIPNVFSPNGDGINDVFEVKYKNAEIMEFVIYNRWGVKIYEGKNFSSINDTLLNFVAWDGRTTSGMVCEDGTYFYVIKMKGNQTENISYKGFLQLL